VKLLPPGAHDHELADRRPQPRRVRGVGHGPARGAQGAAAQAVARLQPSVIGDDSRSDDLNDGGEGMAGAAGASAWPVPESDTELSTLFRIWDPAGAQALRRHELQGAARTLWG
jgi:hypothetical protein